MSPLDLREWGMLSGGGRPPISPGPPPDPTTVAGLLAWFDPTVNLTVSGTDVDSWASRYGASNTVSNTGSTRPSYSAIGLLSQPCVSFVRSSSERLFGAANLAAAIDNRVAFTAICAAKFSSVGTTQVMFCAGNTSTSDQCVPARIQTTLYSAFFFAGASGTSISSSAVPTTSPCSFAFVYDGTNGSFRLNGVAFSGGVSARSPTCNVFSIGSRVNAGVYSDFFDGLLGDVTVYDSALSSANCEIVENYLRYKYPGLP